MAGPYTVTAQSARSVQPKGHHVGVHAAQFDFSLGMLLAKSTSVLASSTGLVIQMGKVAVGTRILAIQRNFTLNGGVVQVGMDTSLSAFSSSLSCNTGIAWLTTGFPATVSMSDDANPRYRVVNINVPTAISLSAGGNLRLTVFLSNDNPTG